MTKNEVKRVYGNNLPDEKGLVIVHAYGRHRPYWSPVGTREINEDKLLLNTLCIGACNIYKDEEDVSIFVIYRIGGELFAAEYIGEPIFDNPNCCGGKLGC